MSKYIKACNGDKAKAICLYHYNIQLSERMFAVINMFEIILRNAIDKHYRVYYSDQDWLLNQAAPGKMLSESASDIIIKGNGFKSDGRYSPDRMVSSFMMGFWTYMFTRRHYNAGGKTLLKIFPNRAKGTTQKLVYSELGEIRELNIGLNTICPKPGGAMPDTLKKCHTSCCIIEKGRMTPPEAAHGFVVERTCRRLTTDNLR